MNTIIWGAGKIGRGFVADILFEGGHTVTFVDRNRELTELLNRQKSYTIFKAYADGIKKTKVADCFTARHTDEDMSDLFLSEDVFLDVAVFKGDLPSAADMIAPYIELRAQRMPASVMDIVTNVNMVSPEKVFRELLNERLSEKGRKYLAENTGISGIFMICISPNAEEYMLIEDPAAVYNNAFPEQAIDANVLKGRIPVSPRLRLSHRLEAEEARKLYTINMVHCALAFLGIPKGYTTSYKAVQDHDIRQQVSQALDESLFGLHHEFGFSDRETGDWKKLIFDLLDNPYMSDPLTRLGADTKRKLSGNDRLVMPARLCDGYGRKPETLCRIIRAGYSFVNDDPGTVFVQEAIAKYGLETAVKTVSDLCDGNTILELILQEV